MARTPAIRYGTVMDIAMTLATGPLAPLLRDGDLPGPMNLNRLADFGTLCKLDSANAYTLQDSTTLYGRATIVATVMPRNAVACGFTAAWLWLGGLFPETIDILSSSHFRTLRHGRKVRVFNRKAPPDHVIQVGPVRTTTPVRTACDLALIATDETKDVMHEVICMLMQEYRFRPDDCLQALQQSRHIRNASQARPLFHGIAGGAHEQIRRGTIAEIHQSVIDEPPRGEMVLVIAGASDEEADAAAPASLSVEDLAVLSIDRAQEDNLRIKDAIAQVVAEHPLADGSLANRKQVYNAVLALKG